MLSNKDPWAKEYKEYAFYGSEELNEMMKGKFKVKSFEPEPHHGTTATGEEKEWHEIVLETRCVNKNLVDKRRKKDEEER